MQTDDENQRFAAIRIRDQGSGIPEELRDRVFDPFFTSKGRDRGSGLGLSIVYGIVEAHGGTVEIESTSSKGTCMAVFLPLVPYPRPLNATEFPAQSYKTGKAVSSRR